MALAVIIRHAVGLSGATVLGLLANRVATVVVPSGKEIQGFPRWRWLVSVFTQMILFPGVIALCCVTRQQSMNLKDWLVAPTAVLADGYESWFIYALFGAMSRDMLPTMPAQASTLFKVHHWLVAILCMLTLSIPEGLGLFVAGTFVLECGSLTYNLRELYPTSSACWWLYQLTMPLTNIVAFCGGIFLAVAMPGVPIWLKVVYFLAISGVCWGRQRHAFKDAKESMSSMQLDMECSDPSPAGRAVAMGTTALPEKMPACQNRHSPFVGGYSRRHSLLRNSSRKTKRTLAATLQLAACGIGIAAASLAWNARTVPDQPLQLRQSPKLSSRPIMPQYGRARRNCPAPPRLWRLR